uniref:Uncharacterized protein n=1 Tax=Nelumbo nucifera TaxID=4432 RepID=A0A822ZP69_NELNU|nr:TPA_asm: hypothetical protein HUJ06_016634 [Nelumbo nucifera]
MESNKPIKSSFSDFGLLEICQAINDISACSSDISGELQRQNLSSDIFDNTSRENLKLVVRIYVGGLQSPPITIKHSAAAKLRRRGTRTRGNCSIKPLCMRGTRSPSQTQEL